MSRRSGHLCIFPRSTLSSTLIRFSGTPEGAEYAAVMQPVLNEVSPSQDYLVSYENFQAAIMEERVSVVELENLRQRIADFLCVYRPLYSANRAAVSQLNILIEQVSDDSWGAPPPPPPTASAACTGSDDDDSLPDASSENDVPVAGAWDGTDMICEFVKLASINAVAVRNIFASFRWLADCTTKEDDLAVTELPSPLSVAEHPVQDCPPLFTHFSPEVQREARLLDSKLWTDFPTRSYLRYLRMQPDDRLPMLLDYHLTVRDEETVIRLFCRDLAAALDEALAERAGFSTTATAAIAAVAKETTACAINAGCGGPVLNPRGSGSLHSSSTSSGEGRVGRVRWASPLCSFMC